jgi:hypothetical protein
MSHRAGLCFIYGDSRIGPIIAALALTFHATGPTLVKNRRTVK